jgi:glucosamine--fructose-6-phosphate aminotransferase (isomerizing)
VPYQPGSAMAAEIREQPTRVRAAFDGARTQLPALAALLGDARSVVFLGRGSSRSASSFGALALQRIAGVPARLGSPAELGWGPSEGALDGSLVVAVSQSGESTEMVAAAEAVLRAGRAMIVVTNTADSTMAGLVPPERLLLCHAGLEQAVPATKSFTTSLACLLSIALSTDSSGFERAVVGIPSAMEEMLALDPAPPLPPEVGGLILVGEGYASAVAEEGAIKFREVLKMLVASLEASDFLHGSITSAQPAVGVVTIAADGIGTGLATKVLVEAQSRGATTFGIGPEPLSADHAGVVPAMPAAWVPFAAIVWLQQMALATGLGRGLDPDRPPGLSKITRIGAVGD